MRPAAPGSWSDVVIVCAAAPWHGARRLDHHLALGLSRYAPVLYVDPPTPWRATGFGPVVTGRNPRPSGPTPGLTMLDDRLALLTPHVVGPHRRGLQGLARRQMHRAVRHAVAALGHPRVRAVVVPTLDHHFGIFDGALQVLYVSDAFVAGTRLTLSPHRFARELRRQPAQADLVVAASPALADALRAGGHDPLLLPNGVDADAFAATDQVPAAAGVWLEPPIAGYVGHLSSRVDVRHLRAVADRGHSVLLVGSCPRGSLDAELRGLLELPNVAWVGPRSFDELPSYLRHIDVGLVPYADTPYNRAVFSLTALEHLAAGRPIVSTPTGSMTWLRDQHDARTNPDTPLTARDLVIAAEPELFADRVEQLFVAGRDEVSTARRRAAARSHSWTNRLATLAEAMGLADAEAIDRRPDLPSALPSAPPSALPSALEATPS